MQVQLGNEFLDRLLRHLLEVVPNTCGVGISVAARQAPAREMAALGVAERLDALQGSLNEGPLIEAQRTEQPVICKDLLGDDRWPRLDAALRTEPVAGLGGMIALPGAWDNGGPVLLTVYFNCPPSDADLQSVLQLEPLLATALAFVDFCSGEVLRADQMLSMMQYRRVIEQAKGLVMTARSCDATEAFETLTRASQHFNVRVRDLCIALVEHVGRGPAEQPEDPTSITQPSDRTRNVGQAVWAAINHGADLSPDREARS